MKIILHFSITVGACQNIPGSDLAWKMLSFCQFVTFDRTVPLLLDTKLILKNFFGYFENFNGTVSLGFFEIFSTDFSKKSKCTPLEFCKEISKKKQGGYL